MNFYYIELETLDVVFLWIKPEMEFKEFDPLFKSAKTWFKLGAGLNLKTLDSILSGTNHI